MVDIEDVERLSALARITVSEDKKEILAKEMSEIVDFVSQVQELSSDAKSVVEHKNIMREDGEPHAGNLYTEDLLKTAATAKGRDIVVPKIISND
ncbi:Asp-tRNA(Asn)/Glu-tRNA(Gln) amidotransferase subunit GatC [Candidatus Wolfebacteria bacterium]|nr:Asp-tRNA(Asn)/Glu-tRNA(Gln) amidotransferase subunit GatC [Candidatus Wolfebacteria bacterium]